MNTTPRCLICNSEETEHELDLRDFITCKLFALQHCCNCGFRFTNPHPLNLDEYYPTFYRSYGSLVLAIFRALHRRRVRIWTHQRGGSGIALEIGCGHGWTLAALRDAGWDVTGLERTEESAQFARKTLSLPVNVGDIGVLDNKKKFDLIVMNQVLEHLPDPMQRLQACARILKPGGWLVIGVPNLASWQFQFFRQHWVHLDVPRHLGHFTPITLDQSLNRAGLKTEKIRYMNFEYDPFGWIQGILNLIGFEQNIVLSWLTGQKRTKLATPSGILAALLTALLIIPSLMLSIASWVAKKGAIMEVRAIHAD